ncbi:MAG TPA: NADH-quinone oxidoreductase subunit L [Polyangia bacterium]
MLARELLRASLILASLVPAGFVLAALFVSRRSPFGSAMRATSLIVKLSVAAVALRCLSAFFSWIHVSADGSTIDSMMRGLVQLDVVSSPMLLLVCTLALVVVRFSRTYLAAEGGLERYVRSLLLTLASVTLLVISNHLGVVIAAWLATGIGLHQLLTFYRTRRQAVIVAHKEFLLSRLADLFFFASVYLIDSEVGSLHIDVVNDFVIAKGLTPGLHLATALLVVGVLLKSAQLPFHGWMQQVMEAPTPVSALLHAGIVNIGGFVMIRLAPLMAHAPLAQWMLLTVGLATAIVGSLVMTTRVSAKVILAWSTVAQMGFMLVQCGLGVWHLALLHLLAHSCYKAHCFLSTGGAVDSWRGAHLVRPPRPSVAFTALGIVLLGVVASPFYLAFTHSRLHASPSLGPLALALVLSFVPTIARALAAGWRALGLAALFCAGATALYYALHLVFEGIAPAISAEAESPFKWKVVTVGLVVLFVAQTLFQTNPRGRLARYLLPHLSAGLYIDEWFTRLTFRIWPPRLERAAVVAQPSVAVGTQEAG